MNCIQCGKELAPPKCPRRRRKYCSDGCRRAADRARKQLPPPQPTWCFVCGAAVAQPIKGRRRKYCAGCVQQLRHQTPALKSRKTARKIPQL